MSETKLKKTKSKRSSPRLYDSDNMPKFMQPLLQARTGYSESRTVRPKAEILRELKRLRSVPAHSDDDDDNVSGVPATPIQTLEQLDALRLTRHRIKQLLRSPNFDQTVRNCFVRLNINALNVPPEYRIAEIMGVEELPVGYYVDKIPTNIVLHLRYEDLMEKHELNSLSNMSFTREEFELWHDNCICQAIDWPTTDLIAQKKIELYNALNGEGKLASVLQQSGLLPLTMPMRPPPKRDLLARFGGVYPWKLQRPTKPPPPLAEALDTPTEDASVSADSLDGPSGSEKPEVAPEAVTKATPELEAQRLETPVTSGKR